MLDVRITAKNERLADYRLQGVCDAPRFVEPRMMSVITPVTDLYDAPQGKRIRQCVYGTDVEYYETYQGFAFIKSTHDGYIGYVDEAEIGVCGGDLAEHMYRICTASAQVYTQADMKGGVLGTLPFGAKVHGERENDDFYRLTSGPFQGFVARQQVQARLEYRNDLAQVARLFLGTPYLWGGNTPWGVDCSGLTQAIWMACGVFCPADSDMQAAQFGRSISENTSLQLGDLIFWPGHVGMMMDSTQLIHANAFHMASVIEPLSEVRARISKQEGHDISAKRRYVCS